MLNAKKDLFDYSDRSEHVLLDICTECHAKCVYCVHQRQGMVKPLLIDKELALTIISILSKEKFKIIHLFMSGEPFLHPDIHEFISASVQGNLLVHIATKFAMPIDFDKLDNVLIEANKKKGNVLFTVEISSFDKETTRKISPGVNLKRLMSNLRELAQLAKRHESLCVQGQTIVTKWNESELDNIKATLAEYGFDKWRTKAMGYYMPQYASQENLKALQNSIPSEEHCPRFSVIGDKVVNKRNICGGIVPAIGPTGNVTICCHDMLYQINTGNVLEEGSLRKILDSPKYKETVELGRQRKLKICEGCN